MSPLIDVVGEAFSWMIGVALVLGLAAVLGGLVGGAMAALLGVPDPTLAVVGRAAAVFVTLLWFGAGFAESLQRWTSDLWGDLPAWGSSSGSPPLDP